MKNGVWIWLAVILLVVIVLIDWYVPLGTAVGVLYLFVIVLVSRESKRVILLFSVLTILLTALNPMLLATAETPANVYLNRTLSIAVIVMTSIYAIYKGNLEERSEEMRRNLDRSTSYNTAILDSVSSHIAVLNEDGEIISTNRAWAEFGKKSGLPDLKGISEGANYFEVLKRSKQAGDLTAEETLNGMLEVKENIIQLFEREYPCHTETEKQWFVMKVSRLKGFDDHLVVVHEDITSRILAERSLQTREETWREMVRNLPGFVYRCKNSKDWPAFFVSEGFDRITGYRAADINKENTFNLGGLVDPDYVEYIWEGIQKALKPGEIFIFEYPIITKNGEQKWFWERGQGVFDEEGELVYIEGFVSDITERKRSEEYIRKRLSMEELHVRVSEAAVGHENVTEVLEQILADLGGTMEASRAYIFKHNHSNDTLKNTLEWCADKIEPQIHNMQEVPAGDFSDWTNPLSEGKIVCEDNALNVTNPVIKEMIREQDIQAILLVPLFVNGEYYGFMGFDDCVKTRNWDNEDIEMLKSISLTISNLLERRKAEESLIQERARLDNILKSNNLGTWEWNLQTDEIIYNERWAEIVGFLPENLELNSIDTWRQLMHPEDEVKSDEILQQHIEGKIPFYECEVRMKHKDGHWVWVLDKGKIMTYTPDGKPEWIYGTHTEITDSKLAEQEIKKQNLELEKRNNELDRFVYSTSHDLRAPLASLLGLISIAESNTSKNDREQREIFRMMEKSVRRLDGFIGDILDYSRNLRQDVERELIDFEKLLQEQVEGLEHLNDLVDHKVNVSVKCSGDFYSDKRRISVILNNLISNAVKYLDPDKEESVVNIDIHSDDQLAKITIEDNGIGIKEEHQEKIFDMFYRATSVSDGSGIGLYITKESVEKLGGSMSMESTPGKGTRFEIKLPNLKHKSQDVE